MDLPDTSVTSSDAYICRNIYLFIVVITHVMHIQDRQACAKNKFLLLTTAKAPIQEKSIVVCRCKTCCLHTQTDRLVRVPRPDFGPYPALRVKVFFFADSGSPEGRLQFPGG